MTWILGFNDMLQFPNSLTVFTRLGVSMSFQATQKLEFSFPEIKKGDRLVKALSHCGELERNE